MKICKTCGIEKDAAEYSGRQTVCKPCFNEVAKAKRALKKETHAAEGAMKCVSCEKEKPSADFYAGRSKCKDCHNEERKERNEKLAEVAPTVKKICKECNEEKTGDLFVLSTLTCKACFSEKNKEANHRPSDLDPPKVCRNCETELPATHFRHQEATCKECNKLKLYGWREDNKEQFLAICKKYRTSDEAKEVRRVNRNAKYREDIVFKLIGLYRTRVRLCIKKKYYPKNTAFDYATLLGCPWDFLVGWLEFNMTDAMTWENYGPFWHVDHVIPCASFDFSKEEDRRKCFNWTNLMPLEGIENIKKSDTMQPQMIDYAKKRAIEFLTKHSDMIDTILTDALPEDLRLLVTSGVLTTKDAEAKAASGSGEKSEVR
jgi:hypothetical protein